LIDRAIALDTSFNGNDLLYIDLSSPNSKWTFGKFTIGCRQKNTLIIRLHRSRINLFLVKGSPVQDALLLVNNGKNSLHYESIYQIFTHSTSTIQVSLLKTIIPALLELIIESLQDSQLHESVPSQSFLFQRIMFAVAINGQFNLSRSELEKLFSYNSDHLNRIFKKFSCLSIKRYSMLRRLQKVKTNYFLGNPLEQEIEAVGMAPQNFHRQFKKTYGLSPLQFKKNHLKNDDSCGHNLAFTICDSLNLSREQFHQTEVPVLLNQFNIPASRWTTCILSNHTDNPVEVYQKQKNKDVLIHSIAPHKDDWSFKKSGYLFYTRSNKKERFYISPDKPFQIIVK